MKKYVLAAALAASLAAGPALAQENEGDKIALTEQVFEPSVRLDLAGQGWCSGTIIHSVRNQKTGLVETYVLTAKHCTMGLKDYETVNVQIDEHNKKGRETRMLVYPASIWGQSFKSDLAILKLKDTDHVFEHTAKVAPANITLNFGDDVDVSAYPMGLSLTWTQGHLAYVEDQDGFFHGVSESGEFYRATPDVAPGSSGSGMFIKNGGEYELIGVATGSLVRAGMPFINWFTPIDEIDNYLDTAKKAWADQ